ncbi:MAG: RluA family pseudouridine synthase [Crocinitomicaceae bacterium]|nr:RluA family pseudouridine synthase [Crocinitomicaceae bacterium]
MSSKTTCFTPFESNVEDLSLPEKFTFPFYYEPHPIAIRAAEQLQSHLRNNAEWKHNFGLNTEDKSHPIGKMFGVLVVKNTQGQLGFLSGFSGKIDNANHHKGFVPPVYDMLAEDGFFNSGATELTVMNNRTRELENGEEYKEAKQLLAEMEEQAAKEIEARRLLRVANRKARKELKLKATLENKGFLPPEIKESNFRQSMQDKHELAKLTADWKEKIANQQVKVDVFADEIASLKKARKLKSNDLQKQIFDNYHFLNFSGEEKSLWTIFQDELQKQPPSGAGECAAPKLLQYAYQQDLKPIALAEFWWGISPKSEIRKHGHFYPSCRGKCEPILGHMLKGLSVDENPMLVNPADGKKLPIIFEDEHIIVVNKPSNFLSVPGKTISDSVYTRIKQQYPEATGPLIIHRLDMSTSGILLLAKTKSAHKYIQYQFIHRQIDKTYIALLNGELERDLGIIDLPLRTDIDDRPRQLVCHDYGKPAQTEFKVLSKKDGKTRIQFHPITGRTHQLRVHAAHSAGLDMPIVGDDLYGTKASRLYLHAASITFRHPGSKEPMTIDVVPEF